MKYLHLLLYIPNMLLTNGTYEKSHEEVRMGPDVVKTLQRTIMEEWPNVLIETVEGELIFDISVDSCNYTSDASINLLMITVRHIAWAKHQRLQTFQELFNRVVPFKNLTDNCDFSNSVFDRSEMPPLSSDTINKLHNNEPLAVYEMYRAFILAPHFILANEWLYERFFYTIASIYEKELPTAEEFAVEQQKNRLSKYRFSDAYKDLGILKYLFGPYVDALVTPFPSRVAGKKTP